MTISAGVDEIQRRLEAKNLARESGLTSCRQAIRRCANAIRAVHRGEAEPAERLLLEARNLLDVAESTLAAHPDVAFAGFLLDAQKEYAEGRATRALVAGQPVPSPGELAVPDAAWLTGLAEAVGELRRHVLDRLRDGDIGTAEVRFADMAEIVDLLAGFDFPDAITGGLRRLTDVARSIVERTRGDLTLTTVQRELADALRRLPPGTTATD